MITEAQAREYVTTLLQHFPQRLSEWEDTFLRDMRIKLDREEHLSLKQLQKIDDVMERCAQQHGRSWG